MTKIAVIATLRAQPGKGDALADALRRVAQKVRSDEPGCSYYQPCRSREEPDLTRVLEVYDSPEAIDAHRETPHFAELKDALASLLAEAPTVERLDVID